MAATVQVKCKCCNREFTARVADQARGWGKFCSKRCKAIKQQVKRGFMSRPDDGMESPAWDAHKEWTS